MSGFAEDYLRTCLQDLETEAARLRAEVERLGVENARILKALETCAAHVVMGHPVRVVALAALKEKADG